ncbi:MAG: HEAT repeat domain-containing protein [Acidimicrobiales bacterium]|jgi:HEAT repeat protein
MTGPDDEAATRAARRRGDAALAGHLRDEAAARLLLGDDDGEVRASALGALVRMGRATPEDSARALADLDGRTRRRACELGAALPGADFAGLLEDPDEAVVEAACFALGEVGDVKAVPALAEIASNHTDPLCRESAVAALGAIGEIGGLPAILAGLDDKAQIRRRAVIALAAIDSPQSEAALRRCLEDRDWQVRQAAEDLLAITTGDD